MSQVWNDINLIWISPISQSDWIPYLTGWTKAKAVFTLSSLLIILNACHLRASMLIHFWRSRVCVCVLPLVLPAWGPIQSIAVLLRGDLYISVEIAFFSASPSWKKVGNSQSSPVCCSHTFSHVLMKKFLLPPQEKHRPDQCHILLALKNTSMNASRMHQKRRYEATDFQL